VIAPHESNANPLTGEPGTVIEIFSNFLLSIGDAALWFLQGTVVGSTEAFIDIDFDVLTTPETAGRRLLRWVRRIAAVVAVVILVKLTGGLILGVLAKAAKAIKALKLTGGAIKLGAYGAIGASLVVLVMRLRYATVF